MLTIVFILAAIETVIGTYMTFGYNKRTVWQPGLILMLSGIIAMLLVVLR